MNLFETVVRALHMDQLLRAGSRACLHLLVVLERLPLSPKDQNINTLHGYLQKTLKAYELYNSAQPYFGYMQTASYLGRWLAGATPVTLGLSWALTEFGKRGAKAAANLMAMQLHAGHVIQCIDPTIVAMGPCKGCPHQEVQTGACNA